VATWLTWCVTTRPPLIQHSPERTEKFVYVVLVVAFVTYARFVMLVISDITDYLGIACLTVRRRDANGVWKSAVGMRPTEKKGLLD
jgi:ethanolaminephosphotransferase